MEWLNYHHLLYFWTVAREGSIVRACEKLHLAQPTISGQLKALEQSLGEKLFQRAGRGLVLTEQGKIVYRYADEIFSLGRELTDVLKGRPQGKPIRLVVGISDVMPKLIAYHILAPALSLKEQVQIICQEGRSNQLVTELVNQELDLVLTDAPLTTSAPIHAFNHFLGSSGVTLFATTSLANRYRKNFPHALSGAPFLLPIKNSTLRRSLDQWFDRHEIQPQIIGEFQDSALITAFGEAGKGIFAAPAAMEKQVRQRYKVAAVGRVRDIVERFYAISIERRLKHPAVVAISEAARSRLVS